MTFIAFIFVLVSVFMHAAWNMISKSVKPCMAFYAIMSFTGMLVWLPFLVMGNLRPWDMPLKFHLLFFGSVLAEVMYMLGLARAYRRGDISLVYPVMRALPVILVALTALVFQLGKTPSGAALGGMVLITAGCLIMPLASFREFTWGRYFNRTIGFVLLGAIGTTCYTVCDSSALKVIRETISGAGTCDTLGYLCMIEGGLTVGELLFVVSNRTERQLFKKLFGRSIYPVLAGLCSSGAYGLILLAMRHVSNVSYIQAFRQMSLPVGFLAGVLILKERGSVPKTIGMIAILTGLILCAVV